MEAEGCKLLEVVQQDGITNEMMEKLRSKKKAHRDQSEEDRWKEIYQILFPREIVPSPCKYESFTSFCSLISSLTLLDCSIIIKHYRQKLTEAESSKRSRKK